MPHRHRTAVLAAVLLGGALGLGGCSSAEPAPHVSASPTQQPATPVVGGAEYAFTDSAGTRSGYRLWRPSTRPNGLLIVLDGDGQWGYEHPDDEYLLGGPDGVAAVGTERGYAVIAVRAPDDEDTWWQDGNVNADYLHELLPLLREQLTPTGSDVWLVGYSGGSQQITQHFLPLHGTDLSTGGVLLFGGGGRPEGDAQPVPPAGPFVLHWYTGQDDTAENAEDGYDAISDARDGAGWYRDHGFDVRTEFPEGVDHDLGGEFGTLLAATLDGHAHDGA